LTLTSVCVICCCLYTYKIINSADVDKCNLCFYKAEYKETGTSGETVKIYACYDPLYCFLFALALLCVAGGLIVICVLHCSALKKQALLTYAYDRALDSLEEVKDTDELDGSIEIEERQNNNQNNNIIKTTQSKHKDYKKTIAEIFEAYCQNITAK